MRICGDDHQIGCVSFEIERSGRKAVFTVAFFLGSKMCVCEREKGKENSSFSHDQSVLKNLHNNNVEEGKDIGRGERKIKEKR